MKSLRILAASALLISLPAAAFAGVTFKNKEKKSVELTIKRAGSSQNTGIPGGVTMDIPGSPMTVTVNPPAKSKAVAQKMEAVDGDTLVWEKGKLTKEANPDAEPEAPKEPESAPDAK